MNRKGFSFVIITICILVLFAVIPITVLAVQLNDMMRVGITDQIWNQKKSISQMTAIEIENYIQNASKSLEAITDQPAVYNYDDLAAQRQFVDIFQRRHSQFLYVYVMDIEGNIVNVVPQEGWSVTYFGDKEWFAQIKQTNSSYYSDSFISAATNEPMIFIAHPIRDEKGDFHGAIGANIDLRGACDQINKIKSGDTGIAFVIDKTGTIVAHPEDKYVIEQKKFDNELVSEVLSGKSGIGEYIEDDGTEKITAYASAKALGWGVFFAQDRAEAMSLIDTFNKKVILTLLVCITIALVFGYFVSILVAKMVRKLVKQTQDMAMGDLRNRDITASWIREFIITANAFNDMKANLRNFIKKVDMSSKDVRDSSGQLAKASNEVTVSVQELAQVTQTISEGSQSQAEYSSKILESMEEFSGKIKDIDKNIMLINDEVKISYEKAVEGQKLALDSSSQMSLINKKVGESSKVLSSLEGKSSRIGEILGMITDVADQTNLLSLNAAIEAARAGENGRGLAVVAEEIRQLSEETNNSAQQISGLILEIQKEIKKYIGVMDNTIDEVQGGVKIINSAEKSFKEIAQSVEVLPDRIEEIIMQMGTAVREIENKKQDLGEISNISQQLAAGAEEMAASTQEQSATVQQITSAIQILAKMAEELDQELNTFQI